jgi:hypothetical protein
MSQREQREFVSQREYARRRGVSSTWVSRLAREGKIPQLAGRIDVLGADQALASEVAQAGDGRMTLLEARTLKEAALAGLRRLQLRREEGEVVSVADVSTSLCQHNLTIRNNLLRLPSTLAARLPSEVRPLVVAVATAEVHRALTELAAIVGDVIDFEKWPLCEGCRKILAGETLEGNHHEQPQ